MQPPDATPSPENFSRSGLVADRLGWAFRHVDETGSTNVDLVREAREGNRAPAVLTTDHQTAGKGRLDRTWEDDGRSQLMVSLRIPVSGGEASWIVGAVAAAARAALAELGAPVGFKWPNDLMIESDSVAGKAAGVLAEFVPGDPDVVVVGMGLNIGPPGIPGAASLREAGCEASRDDVLAGLLSALPARLADPALVRAELSEHSVTLGRRVRVERTVGELTGQAVEIDGEGRLIIDVDGVTHVVAVGDVVHLRPTYP